MIDLKLDIPLQAVIFGDSYDTNFEPITLEKPKMLLNLAGTPMLSYTLEFLRQNDVMEVIVLISQHIDKLEKFIDTHYSGKQGFRIVIVKSKLIYSAGDALREVDSLGIIRSDPFILCYGDTISNLNLKPIIKEHMLRRKQDKSCILTSIFQKTTKVQQKEDIESDLVVFFDATSKRLIKYEDSDLKAVNFEFDDNYGLCVEHNQVEVRYDLKDCEVYICSHELLLEVAGNYDYKDLKRDYIKNEVKNRDIGYKIYLYELQQNKECSRITDFRSLVNMSSDVMNRLTYPFVPDREWSQLFVSSQYSLNMVSGFQYIAASAYLEDSCYFVGDCLVGTDSCVGDSSLIENTIIEKTVTIGKNCYLINSIISSNVVIGDDVVLKNSFVLDNCKIGSKSKVNNCVISYNVTLPNESEIPDFSLLSTKPEILKTKRKLSSYTSGVSLQSEEAESISELVHNTQLQHATFYNRSILGKEDAEITEGRVYIQGDGLVPLWAVAVVNEQKINFNKAKHFPNIGYIEQAARDRFFGFDDFDSDDEREEQDSSTNFILGIRELVNPLEPAENLLLEISCFKYAEHRSSQECFAILILCVFSDVMPAEPHVLVKEFKVRLDIWKDFIAKVLSEDGCAHLLFECVELMFLFQVSDIFQAWFYIFDKKFSELDHLRKLEKEKQLKFPFVLAEILTLLPMIDLTDWLERRKLLPLSSPLLELELTQQVISAQLYSESEYDSDSE